MAYRQLCAVSFVVLGVALAACGGSTTAAASDSGSNPTTSDQPPNNKDQPPASGKDSTPPSSDAPPASSDKPPGSSETPAGSGGVAGLCQQFCSRLASIANDCSDGMAKVGMDGVCKDSACQIPAGVPCQGELAGLLNCLLDDLGSLCHPVQSSGSGGTANQGGGDQPASTDFCPDEVKTYEACAQANGVSTSDNNNNPPAGTGDPCDQLTDDCAKCDCRAGADLTKLQACLAGACANK